MKKAISMLLALVLVLSLGACGEKKPETPEEVLEAAGQRMAQAESAAFELEMNLIMTAGEADAAMKLTAGGEMIAEPQTVHMDMALDLGTMAMQMQMYSQQDGRVMHSYAGMDLGNGMVWVRQDAEAVSAPAAVFTGLPVLASMEVQEAGETVDDIPCTVYSGTLSGEDLLKVMDSMDSLNRQLLGQEVDPSVFRESLASGSIPVTYLIDPEALLLREMRLDMTSLMKNTVPPEAEGMGIDFKE